MRKLHSIIMVALIIVIRLAIPASAGEQGQTDITTLLSNAMLLAAMVETGQYGTGEGPSFIGKWDNELGRILTVDKVGTKIRARDDYGHGYVVTHWLTLDGDTLYIDNGISIRRTMRKPDFQVMGKYLSTWVYQGYKPGKENQVTIVFSASDADLNFAVAHKEEFFRGAFRREGDEIFLVFPDTEKQSYFKAATPDTTPSPDVWKTLREDSRNELVRLVTMTALYAKYHDDKLPPMKDDALFRKVLIPPGLRIAGLFKQLGTDAYFKLNHAVSGKDIKTLQKSSGVVLFYDANPWPDGTRCVAFASALSPNSRESGIKILSEAEWAKVAKANHLK